MSRQWICLMVLRCSNSRTGLVETRAGADILAMETRGDSILVASGDWIGNIGVSQEPCDIGNIEQLIF